MNVILDVIEPPEHRWKRERRGYYTLRAGELTLYVERTRHGWAYGCIDAGGPVECDWTTRPLARAKTLAERLAEGQS